MPPVTYSQIYRGRLLSASAFARLLQFENVSREWYTHVDKEHTIMHVPGCIRTLNVHDHFLHIDAPVIPWSNVIGVLGQGFMDPFVNISLSDFEQLRKYLSYIVSPDEKDGIFILQMMLSNVGAIQSMTFKCNVRVNVDFYMNFVPVYDMQRRSLDNENRPYLRQMNNT